MSFSFSNKWYITLPILRDKPSYDKDFIKNETSHRMGKPTICTGESKGADQLGGNREDDQRLCFRCTDSRIPLLVKYKISSIQHSSVTVQAGLCRTWSKPTLLVFSHTGSNDKIELVCISLIWRLNKTHEILILSHLLQGVNKKKVRRHFNIPHNFILKQFKKSTHLKLILLSIGAV